MIKIHFIFGHHVTLDTNLSPNMVAKNKITQGFLLTGLLFPFSSVVLPILGGSTITSYIIPTIQMNKIYKYN